ncbi:MAG: hypothetical protein S4CHLAM6_12690 [Chlamydiae bacterium]|nr:hypothetical protein [Chlamydiota bacterium]
MKLVKESLFSSTVRSFCISFFAVIGIIVAFFLVLLVFGAGKSSKATEASMYEAIVPDTNGRKYIFDSNQPLLLRINITGQIGHPNLNTGALRSLLNESRSGPFKSHPVKGILLYINTPGGSAIDSESMYYALKDYALKYQVPIYAYVEGLCASGGMYIACAAEKIYSSETSSIGSVGVIAMYFNYSEGMQKVGVQNKTLSAGANKDSMNPFKPWAETTPESYTRRISLSYDQFLSVVSTARPKLTESLLRNKYGAQMYYSTDAEEYGYIDGAGYQYDETVQMLAKAADIADNNFQIVQLQPKFHLSDLLAMNNKLIESQGSLNWLKKNILMFMSPNKEELMNIYLPSYNQ